MKNAKVLFIGLAVSAFVFASCGEKCITCTYTVDGIEATSGEVCGSKIARDLVETTWTAAAEAEGATVTCN